MNIASYSYWCLNAPYITDQKGNETGGFHTKMTVTLEISRRHRSKLATGMVAVENISCADFVAPKTMALEIFRFDDISFHSSNENRFFFLEKMASRFFRLTYLVCLHIYIDASLGVSLFCALFPFVEKIRLEIHAALLHWQPSHTRSKSLHKNFSLKYPGK